MEPRPFAAWLRDLIAVSFTPMRATARILESRAGTSGTSVVLLVILAGLIEDFRLRALLHSDKAPWWLGLAVFGAILFGAAVLWAMIQLYAWAALLIGRTLFEGEGTFRPVRLAVAWGMAPIVWTLLWRIPIALFAPPGAFNAPEIKAGKGIVIDPGVWEQGCGMTAAHMFLNTILVCWYLAVAGATLAVALRFSFWRGLGTVFACLLLPLVIAVAALLASL